MDLNNLVYIISQEQDIVTDLVEEWLISYKIPYKRIDDDSFISISMDFNNLDFFNGASVIWHRRGKINLLPINLLYKYPNRTSIYNYIKNESERIIYYIETKLKSKLKQNYIGSYIDEIDNNKLINLDIANDLGLNIPKTLITSEKKQALLFLKKYKKIISKDLKIPVNIDISKNKKYTSTGVKLIDESMLNQLNDQFAPFFLQEFVPKQFEVRTFFFLGKIYSMAIFSQNDIQTQIDFRNYNTDKPNRTIPFLLPKKIEKKIHLFMDKVKMNTGSIDLIVTPKDEYYFLEINPMGQFHWLSQNCNYYIERDIAKHLIDNA